MFRESIGSVPGLQSAFASQLVQVGALEARFASQLVQFGTSERVSQIIYLNHLIQI